MCPKSLVLPSPRSRRVKVAQHFSAGNRSATSPQSVKRTTDKSSTGNALQIQPSVSRTVARDHADPTDKSVGYFQSSASPAFWAKPPEAGPLAERSNA
jgi:hypothetical protein